MLLEQVNWQKVVENVYIEIVTKYNIYIWLDFLFLNKNHRSCTKTYYGFSICCVITEQLPHSFAFYCFQPQDEMNSSCPQAFPDLIKCDSMAAVVCILIVANLMSQHIGLIKNKLKVRATLFLIHGIFSRYSNKGEQ